MQRGAIPESHPFQQQLESWIVANRVELERHRNQNQRTIAFFERAVQQPEQAVEIAAAEMD